MKVKIGDKIYNSDNECIMVIIDDIDKTNIQNMSRDDFKYCAFPEGMKADKVKNFMK